MDRGQWFAALAGAAAMMMTLGAQALASTPGQSESRVRMAEFGAARAPIGWLQFCRAFPADCAVGGGGATRVGLSEAAWRELNRVNDEVNAAIEPVTDADLYGTEEMWTYPQGRGDCEDYVLLKRRLLIERGWPAEALLVTVVRDERGDGHAVLTVTTSEGDLVLDNQRPEIRRWNDTGYAYEKRQSPRDPNGWVWLRTDRPGARAGGITASR